MSSANTTGSPAATEAAEAMRMLGEHVAVVVDAGTVAGGRASTIIDVTGEQARVLRRGALSLDALNEGLEGTGVTIVDEG